MKFSKIPQYTRWPNYRVNVSWAFLEKWLAEMQEGFRLDLSPEYQRDHVWTPEQETRYVEYILRGGKSGRELHFNCPGWNSLLKTGVMELVDGKQRMKAVRGFLAGEVGVFGGLFIKDFTERLPGICGPDFIIHVNDLATRAEVMQWYVDMNAGGTVHSDAEIARVRAMIEAEKGRDGAP